MNLSRSIPEEQGVKSQVIVDFLMKIKEENHELHSFMLLKNDKVISECWWEPYAPQCRHPLYSLTKSFTSTAIGIAVNEGFFTVDTLVADIFKNEMDELGGHFDEKMKKMTVRNLLTMSTGMEYENWDGDNNIKNFLSSHIKNEPGSVYFYHNLASHMQSAIITKCTGQKLVEYLMPRLFEPLGIEPCWAEDNTGVNLGYNGLNLTTEDIAKFGQLYLQKGKWGDRQLIPESWVNEATSKQINNGDDPSSDWTQGYGYQFTMCRPDGIYKSDGAFGQFCIVMPNENAVIAITSTIYDSTQRILDLIWEILLPALRENHTPSEDKASHNKLLQIQNGLSYLKINENAPNFPKMRGYYKNEKPDNRIISSVYIDFNENDGILALIDSDKTECIYRFEKGKWVDNASAVISELKGTSEFLRTKMYGEWNADENVLDFTVWQYETLFKSAMRLKFNADKTKAALMLWCDGEVNIALEFVKGSNLGYK